MVCQSSQMTSTCPTLTRIYFSTASNTFHGVLFFIDMPDAQAVGAVADDSGCLTVGADRGKLMEEETAEEFGDEVFHRFSFSNSLFS